MLKISRLVWIFVFALAFVAVGNDRAEADPALASWYGSELEGSPTASGEPYNPWGYTAAHKTLPLGTELVVSYGGRSVQVTVNDRGPYVGGRDLDLSQGAATDLGLTSAGVDYVDYSVVGSGGYGGGYGGYGYDGGYGGGYSGGGYAGGGYADGSSYEDPAYSANAVQDGAGTGGVYMVQSGDTLSGIAAQLGTTVGDLAAANGIADPDVLAVGQTLRY